MTDADLIKNLREILSREPRATIQLSSVFEFLTFRWEEGRPTPEEQIHAITVFIKTAILGSGKVKCLLARATERRQLFIMSDILADATISTSATRIAEVLNAFQKEIARVDEEIKKLQQETDGERRLLRALLEKLKQLGHDEVLELPDARAMYPKLF